jgi:hypothetical protein
MKTNGTAHVESVARVGEPIDGPIRCVECGEPIHVVAALDVLGHLWVTARLEGYLWFSVDPSGRAMFRCGACAPREFLVLPP